MFINDTNNRIQPLVIQHYIKLSQNKNLISFAAGLPDVSVLPLDKLKQGYENILKESSSSFQYQPPVNLLKQKIQELMKIQGVSCNLDEILITSGAQQGIYLTANLFFKHNAQLMVEELVYPGFFQVANLFTLEYLPLPCHYNRGIDIDYLENLLKTKKPLPYLYLVCNGNNPQGFTLSNQARESLAYLSEKYNFLIIEDDPYGFLNFSDEKFLPLRAYTQNAIYIGSFSKIIAPSVRVGWIVAEKDIINKLHQLKDMNDLYISNQNHLAVLHILDNYSLSEIIYPQIASYAEKLDYMISAIKHYVKIPYNFSTPKHGMFLWLEFFETDIEKYKDYIINESKVLFIPSSAFAINKYSKRNAIRLNFTSPSILDIELGIKNLSNALSKVTKTNNAKSHI